MKLFVIGTFYRKNSMVLEADAFETISSVKTRIEETEGIPRKLQTLFYGADDLKDQMKLSYLWQMTGTTFDEHIWTIRLHITPPCKSKSRGRNHEVKAKDGGKVDKKKKLKLVFHTIQKALEESRHRIGELEKENEGLKRALQRVSQTIECLICLIVKQTKILQCINGHHICIECKQAGEVTIETAFCFIFSYRQMQLR